MLGNDITPAEVQLVVEHFDADGDGHMDLGEFAKESADPFDEHLVATAVAVEDVPAYATLLSSALTDTYTWHLSCWRRRTTS